jgi:hypothetical protein
MNLDGVAVVDARHHGGDDRIVLWPGAKRDDHAAGNGRDRSRARAKIEHPHAPSSRIMLSCRKKFDWTTKQQDY